MSECYEINSPKAFGEVLGFEAIVMDLEHGHYFSTLGSGALIWAGIEQRATVSAIAQAMQDQFKISADAAKGAVIAFVAELQGHDLVRPCGSAETARVQIPKGTCPEYSEPVLEFYEDMQDILLLDPIHDVDEAGWPMAPERTTA